MKQFKIVNPIKYQGPNTLTYIGTFTFQKGLVETRLIAEIQLVVAGFRIKRVKEDLQENKLKDSRGQVPLKKSLKGRKTEMIGFL